MVNRLVFLIFVLFFCGFISFIAVNGTNKIYGKSEVQNISYKLPESWIANISDKQFRLLELSLVDGGDFNVVLFLSAVFAIFAALSYPMWGAKAVTNIKELSRCS